jgi:putative transposase
VVSVPERLAAVRHAEGRGVSQRRACQLLSVSRSMFCYRHRMPERDAPLQAALQAVAAEQPVWGYRLAAGVLRERGIPVSDKRAHRVWRNAGLCAHRRKRRKLRTGERLKPAPQTANTVWCMDFAEDRIVNGRKFYTLLVKDEASAFCVAAPVSLSFKGVDVVRVLEEATARYGQPAFLRCDNGGQFIARAMRLWAERQGIRIAYIDPGSPWQNGAAESLVATYRREVLDAELFHSLLEAHVLSERWRRLYNERRPHRRLGYRPPITAYLPAQQVIG